MHMGRWSNVKRKTDKVNHGITIDTGEKAWRTGRPKINAYRQPLSECAANQLWHGELDGETDRNGRITKRGNPLPAKSAGSMAFIWFAIAVRAIGQRFAGHGMLSHRSRIPNSTDSLPMK
jgi:hypothetical protein